jgi:hypothetical protein
MLRLLAQGSVIFPPLQLRFEIEPNQDRRAGQLDAIAITTWSGQTDRFAVEVKSQSSTRAFREALDALQFKLRDPELRPMMVLPFLSDEHLRALEQIQFSGIDLCGNGLVIVPNRLFVLRSGSPNPFRQPLPLQNVYRGVASLVARVFLAQPAFGSLEEIQHQVRIRGPAVAISTVSKSLRRLEDDLVVMRMPSREIELRQPDVLLEKLQQNYVPPRVTRVFQGRADDPAQLAQRIGGLAEDDGYIFARLTGLSSADHYAIMARNDRTVMYCRGIDKVLQRVGGSLVPDTRFANFELRETDDPTAYFDLPRWSDTPYASRLQTYLELMAGDQRDRDAAQQIREVILQEATALIRRRPHG